MNKELTPLEALEKLTKIHNHDEFKECYSIIETALKDYENLKLKHRSIQDAVLDDFKKLKPLEDIQDELGVDLITLFKALKNGIYIKELNNDYPYWDFEIRKVSGLGIVIFWGFCGNLFLKDYGKTWALTREELE